MDRLSILDQSRSEKITLLLSDYRSVVKRNDPALFSDLIDSPLLRSRAISKATGELRKINLTNPKLRNLIDQGLCGLEKESLNGENFSKSKKTKLDASMLNESAAPFAEFKTLVPYLDLICASSKKTRDRTVNARSRSLSLAEIYGKVMNKLVFEKRLSNRKYWE